MRVLTVSAHSFENPPPPVPAMIVLKCGMCVAFDANKKGSPLGVTANVSVATRICVSSVEKIRDDMRIFLIANVHDEERALLPIVVLGCFAFFTLCVCKLAAWIWKGAEQGVNVFLEQVVTIAVDAFNI